ncbi:hypothetical protein Pint_04494 [Pistacia integerrima]|uniref:Uncharacterized protein n=1 Tax=Pistacia integerrima TaxID=434235 RepID=A0ACC0Z623_9ROSI|nr:hypothetical protein Pint_04494 [Pistacia integerrima]
MEVVVAIASKVGEYLVKPTVNQVRYLFCFNTIVEKLKEQEINLKLARENVNKDVEIAKNNTDTIKGDVEKWLTDANKILADVEGLKEETGVKKTCLNGWCPNWGCRYWLGRKAAKKTTIMLKLKDNCQFNGVGYPTTLPGIEFLKPSEFFKDMKALQVVTLIDVYPMSFKSLELLTNLQSLKLKGCELRDISFLGKLTGLKVLDLEGSSLAEEWPKELGDQLSELRVLDVRLSEELRIPRDGLRRFSQLEELYTDCDFLWDSDETTSVEESCATLYELNSLSRLVTLSLQIEHRCLPNGFAFRKLERYRIEVPESVLTWFSGKYERSISIRSIEAGSLIAFEELLQNVQSLRLWEIKDMSQWQAPAAAFSNLKTLILSDMSHLEEIYKVLQLLRVDGCPNWTTPIIFEANMQNPPEFLHLQDGNDDIIPVTLVHGLQNLEDVELTGCAVQVVFQLEARGLQQLEELYVEDNVQLEEVFGHKDVAGIMEDEEFELPQLNYLKLRALPSLTNFCPGGCHFKFPSLRKLEFQECGATVPIFSLTGDECVHADEKLKCILPISTARGLQLQDRDVRQNFQLKGVFGHEEKANLMDEKVIVLPQLEELTIVDAPQLISIFYFENVTEWYGKDIRLPKLRKLLFSGLANLISFCPENGRSTWPALEEFRIYHCPNLTMPFLDQVRVQNLMKEVCICFIIFKDLKKK